jgi:hypothetical protein
MTDFEKESLQRDKALWKDVQRIRKNAARCSQEGDSEAGWGEKVYSRILDVALEVPPFDDHIGWRNM